MIKLSDRLQCIANQMEKGETMADIGTDHGFLPLYLWEQKISPKVILTDVSPGSFDKARQCCQEQYPDVSFDLRLGNGLQVLAKAEVDTVVMAGMGGLLMQEMLESNPTLSKSFKKFLLQPRRHPGRLRYYLLRRGYTIINENLVREGRYICEILTVVPKPSQVVDLSMMAQPMESVVWEVPPWYGSKYKGTFGAAFQVKKDALREEYLARKLLQRQERLRGMEKSAAGDTSGVKKEIAYLQNLLDQG